MSTVYIGYLLCILTISVHMLRLQYELNVQVVHLQLPVHQSLHHSLIYVILVNNQLLTMNIMTCPCGRVVSTLGRNVQ